MNSPADASTRLAYLGPEGTFTEHALLSQPDLAEMDLMPLESIPGVLAATSGGTADMGFAAIENSIEGSVNVTLDTLAFETDLLIQREVVLDVELNLLARPGVGLHDIDTVLSYPVALAQCRNFLARELPKAQTQASKSSAGAALTIAENDVPRSAAIGTALAAKVHGLDVLATHIEDHPENQTRFVLVAPERVPAQTGHDKTSIVVFQRADVPGSLLSILQEFAARAINLTRLESRPTKKALGDYCFIIDLEGHVDDEVVADCLRELRSKQKDVKFLGSYPAAGDHLESARRDTDAGWRRADEWIANIRNLVQGDPG